MNYGFVTDFQQPCPVHLRLLFLFVFTLNIFFVPDHERHFPSFSWNWFSKSKINKLEIGQKCHEKKEFLKPEPLEFCGVFFASVPYPGRIATRIKAALLKEFIPICRKAAAPEFFYSLSYVWA